MESPSVPSEHPVVVEATVITAEVPPGLVPEAKADAAPLTVLPGYVPIKSEFLRPTPARVSLDKEGRSSGMNVGSQRADCTAGAAMTQRPTFDGERNFLTGDFIQRAKPIQKGRDAITKAFDRFNSRLANAGRKEQPAGERREREEPATEGTDATVAAAAAHTAVSSPATVIGPELVVPLRRGPKDDECPIARRKRLFENKLVLAPLTTVGNLPFRRICKDFGVDVTVGEMAVGYNLNNLQKSEWSLLRRHESEDIFGLQIATGKGVDAALTAQLLEESAFDYDFIDINCGCPIDLMVSRGCGCGLWEKKNRMRDVVRAFTNFQSRPVTVKVRIGADETNPRLHTVIGEYEGWGASAVTIHGRSRKQRYSRLANWDYIQSCSSLTQLPVIGNGDLLCTEDYVLRKETCPGVTSLMVGRGALLKPWLFTEFKEGRVWDISASERFDVLKKFCSYGLSHWGADEKGVATTRRFLLEWLSFYCRYVPVALLERMPQRMNDRPPFYAGRDDLETLLASDSVTDWVRISEMLLGPVKDDFKFTPKHKSNSYTVAATTSANDGEDQG